MNKKILITLLITFTIGLVVTCGLISVKSESTANLFYSTGVEITTNVTIPTNTNVCYDRSGLNLRATSRGSSVTYSSDIVGEFNIEFMGYSKNTFSGNVFESVYRNDYSDIKELTFHFNDLSNKNNGFDVIFVPGVANDCISPSVKVRANNTDAGISYSGLQMTEKTAYYNSIGTYTLLSGASFCNLALINSVETNYVKPISLTFNPNTMCVYAGVKGMSNYLVWDFSERINDAKDIGFTLDKINKYQVSIEFTEINEENGANLLIYSIDGRDVSWHYLANDKKVGIQVDARLNALVNEKYYISKPLCTNNVKNLSVEINGPLYNEIFDYVDGIYFIPKVEGSYTISYIAESVYGVKSIEDTIIYVYEDYPSIQFVFDLILYEDNYGVGSSIVLPKVTTSGGLQFNEENALLTVYLNDSIINNYDKISDYNNEFIFEEIGEYRFVFHSLDEHCKKEFVINVLSDLPKINSFVVQDMYIENDTISFENISGDFDSYTIKTLLPNGVVSDELVLSLDKIGKYSTTITFNYDKNKNITYTRYFEVNQSTVDLFKGLGSNITTSVEKAWFNTNLEGLMIGGDSTWTAQYVNEIDLSDNTKDDSLIKVAVIPSIIGNEVFSELSIKFTDKYNSDNYFVIDLLTGTRSGSKLSYTYVKAAASGQILSGFLNGVYSDGTYDLYVGGDYGTFTEFSFSGQYYDGIGLNKTIEFFFDNNSKELFLCYSGTTKIEVIDFDMSEVFTNVWNGFSTGETLLTVSTLGYNSGKPVVLIESVDGISLKKDYVIEEDAPLIIVDTENYDINNLPNAVIGKEYQVFCSNGYSKLEGNIDCIVKVYTEYNELNKQEVPVVNNKFVPTKIGIYTIEYSCINSFGKKSVEIIEIISISSTSYVEIATMDELNNIEVKLGEIVTVSDIQFKYGIGRLSVSKTCTSPNGQNVDIDIAGRFLANETGTYTIKYVVTDFLCTRKEFSYKINVTISNKPIINEDVKLPKAFFAGAEYQLPKMEAYDYSTGIKQDALVEISVQCANETKLLNDGKYLPTLSDGDYVTVIYKVIGLQDYVVKKYVVKISNAIDYDNQEVCKDKLFTTENVNNTKLKNTSVLFDIKDSNDSLISYINPIVAGRLNFAFIINELNNNNYFNNINVFFTDSMGKDQVVFTIRYNVINNSFVIINNFDENNQCVVSLEFGKPITFAYKKENKGLYINNVYILTFDETTLGYNFEGFNSNLVYIDIQIEQVVGLISLDFTSISSMKLNDEVSDYASPLIDFTYEINAYSKLGEYVVVPKITVADLILPNSTVSLTVQMNNESVKDVNGRVLNNVSIDEDVVILANNTGVLNITYNYADAFGNSSKYRASVRIVETDAPTIQIDGDLKTKYNINDKIVMPNIIIEDNVTSPEKIIKLIYIQTPTGNWEKYDNVYTFKTAGKYILRIEAYDEFYNLEIKEYIIEVK